MRETDQLAHGIDALGLSVSADAQARLLEFLRLLRKWNPRIRLVGDPERDDAVDTLLVDSLAPLRVSPEGAKRVIDVGSGAGLPGLVMVIARPELELTSLEPIHKKTAFQKTACRELGLDAARVLAQRIEDHHIGDYDLAVSRATFAIDEWMQRGQGLIAAGKGRVVGMVNRASDVPQGCSAHPYRTGLRERVLAVWPPAG